LSVSVYPDSIEHRIHLAEVDNCNLRDFLPHQSLSLQKNLNITFSYSVEWRLADLNSNQIWESIEKTRSEQLIDWLTIMGPEQAHQPLAAHNKLPEIAKGRPGHQILDSGALIHHSTLKYSVPNSSVSLWELFIIIGVTLNVLLVILMTFACRRLKKEIDYSINSAPGDKEVSIHVFFPTFCIPILSYKRNKEKVNE